MGSIFNFFKKKILIPYFKYEDKIPHERATALWIPESDSDGLEKLDFAVGCRRCAA
jgi:hypothetical protein